MSVSSFVARAFVVAVLLAAMASGAARAQGAGTFDHAGLARQALEKHIRPGYEAMVTNAEALRKELDTYCKQRTTSRRRAVDRAFDGLVSAWGRIENIRFGPITTDNRLERMFFWPDRRGLGARQVAATLRERDSAAIDPAQLAAKRVAIQGLGALEIVLFDETEGDAKAPENRAYRCAYATSIATNIRNLAAAVLKEWTEPDGYSRDWLNPGEGNRHFLKHSETTLQLAKSLDNGLERVRDEWVAGPLGFGSQRRQMPAVLGKSKRTLRFIQAGLEGVSNLYVNGGMQKAIANTKHSHPTVDARANAQLVAREIQTGLSQIRKLARQGKPLDPVAMMQPLVAVGFPLKNAREQTAALLSLTANLAIGFNASDGD